MSKCTIYDIYIQFFKEYLPTYCVLWHTNISIYNIMLVRQWYMWTTNEILLCVTKDFQTFQLSIYEATTAGRTCKAGSLKQWGKCYVKLPNHVKPTNVILIVAFFTDSTNVMCIIKSKVAMLLLNIESIVYCIVALLLYVFVFIMQ